MPVSGPTPEELDRAIRELRKIQERHQLDYDEQAWLDTAVGFLAAYPLPPEDGEREALIASLLTQAAEWEARPNSPEEGFTGGEIAEMYLKAADLRKCAALLSIGATVDALEIYRVEKYPGVKFVLLDDVRALLRQPPPPPAVGVSKAAVGDEAELFVEAVKKVFPYDHPGWDVVLEASDKFLADIEALPEAAPGEREAVMAAVFRCGYNCGIDRAQDFARETASDLGPGGSVKPPAHPDAIAVLRAYARHLEEVVRQEGCPDAAVGALSADEVDRLLTGGHLRAAAPPSGVDREAVLALITGPCNCSTTLNGPQAICPAALRDQIRALPEAKAADGWHYLPELPEPCTPVLIAYLEVTAGREAPTTRTGEWCPEGGHWWVDDREMREGVYAWGPVPAAPPLPEAKP